MKPEQINVTHLIQPRFNPSFNHEGFPSLDQNGCIPPNLISLILDVYENQTEKTLTQAPNNVITTGDGKFWTTWNLIFFVREKVKRAKKGPLLYLPNGTPLFETDRGATVAAQVTHRDDSIRRQNQATTSTSNQPSKPPH